MSEKTKLAANKRSSTALGYGRRWRDARRAFLISFPLCVECEAIGQLTEATEVDHIAPHRGDMTKFWDTNNWQSLCATHHARKTAREDSGFGNKRRSSPSDSEAARRKKYAKFGNIFLGEQGEGRVKSLEPSPRRTGACMEISSREIGEIELREKRGSR